MAGRRVETNVLQGQYLPAVNGETMFFNITVPFAAAVRLGTLFTMPTAVDVESIPFATGFPSQGAAPTRVPRHLFIQVPVAAANKVYLTWDNVTAPVAADGGPGMELQPGVVYKFENVDPLITTKAAAPFAVNANTAFQVISKTANQACGLWLSW